MKQDDSVKKIMKVCDKMFPKNMNVSIKSEKYGNWDMNAKKSKDNVSIKVTEKNNSDDLGDISKNVDKALKNMIGL